MPDAPVNAPDAPVHAPSHLPSFLTEMIRHYVTDAAPGLGVAVSKELSKLLVKSGQPPLTPVEGGNVAGVVSALVMRLAGLIG